MRLRRSARLAALLMPGALLACHSTTEVPPAGAWSQVAAGDFFTCALTSAGGAWCWGAGVFGQLGNGDVHASAEPVEVIGGQSFRSLAVGSDHVCALDHDGAAWCWGLDDYRELGSAGTSCNPTFVFALCARHPVPVDGGLFFDSITVAAYTSCAISSAGAAYCWGWNDHGQVGSGALGGVSNAPALVGGGRKFTALSLDITHACGRTPGDSLYCWGSNAFGQLGADTTQTPRCGTGAGFYCSVTPVRTASVVPATGVSAGSTHTCALTAAGEAWCWGSNAYGVLGNPATSGGRAPVPVSGGLLWSQVSAGADHTCALTPAGAAHCWGLNTYGQLAVAVVGQACPSFGSAQPCSTSPVAAQGGLSFSSISAGSSHTCGLTTDGEIWCWGRGTEGQLGDGSYTTRMAPVHVSARGTL